MKRVKDAFDERAAALDGLLGVGRSFDMIGRTLRIGGRRARLWVVNGYADDTVLERAISAWLPIPSLEDVGTLQAFADRYVSVCDAAVETDRLKAVTAVFAGKTLLVIDGFSGGVVLDAKQLRGGAGYQQGAAGQPRRLRGERHEERRPAAPPHPGLAADAGVFAGGDPLPDGRGAVLHGKPGGPEAAGSAAEKAGGHGRGLYRHEPGERGGGHRPAPMVEPLPQDPLYRAAGRGGGLGAGGAPRLATDSSGLYRKRLWKIL